ncbi:hypothetical protein THRCLA_09482 [Thraustotheca clavata]|uniref:Uncharacterized protein n=1 Tax=Thraustotheca clavata TaxID=74557 RepID=A0A1V9YW42_9STRA|nr:hypothetical protein THRCLA_09482 [Thraustotheca clavata]
MNLDLLWEHEKRRSMEEDSIGLVTLVKTKKRSIKRQGSTKQIVAGQCIPGFVADDKLFEKSGFALDYEGHTSKRMNSPLLLTATANIAPVAEVKRKPITIMSDFSSPGKKKATIPHKVAAFNSMAKNHPQARKERAIAHKDEPTHDAFRHYIGDFFSTRGEYVDGMLYMSRMKKSHAILFGSKSSITDTANSNLPPVQSIDGNQLKDALADAPLLNSPKPESDSNASRAKTQSQRCSSTLANWSSNPANARLMVDEGVVQAVILLSKTDDIPTRIHCVTTFMNLSNVSDLRRGIIKLGAVQTIVSILNGCDDKTLQTACALTICNLCCLQGEESALVADGAVGALAALINETISVAPICERGLFNLTCVTEPYFQIEVVIKTLIALSSSGQAKKRTMRMCATAFVNLSNMKRARSRLMEEGIVAAITALLRSPDIEVKHMLAYVLCNISSMRSCRVELVTKGSMNVLVALSSTPLLTPKTQWLIGSTLSNLSKEGTIRLRLVLEGLLSIVTFILRSNTYDAAPRSIADEIRKVCATAIHNCSCSEDTRVKLVERDGVAILTTITTSAPTDTKRMGTLALCNFLMVKQAAIEIATSGALASLFELAMLPNSPMNAQMLYAVALYNLCQNSISRESIGTSGGVAAIVNLCCTNLSARGLHIITLCTAALCYLAADDTTRHFVATLDVVHAITKVLQTELSDANSIPIQRYCCACLSILSQDEACSILILEHGAIEAVLLSCVNSRDSETKACCCDLLASLSYHVKCRYQLVSLGVLPSLTKLAKLRDPDIQRRCATTLGNLASEKAVHDTLLSSNIVSILSILSNSYSEESQSDCAKALCNLSCSPGHEVKLVAEGAIGVLFMISAVRSGSASTKETCARAVGNLLIESTMASILKQGLVKLLPAITKLDAAIASPIPATIYAKLLRSNDARDVLCNETQSLRTLFMYMQMMHPLQSTTDLLGAIACEILLHENTRHRAVQEGLLDAILFLAEKSNYKSNRFVSALLIMALHDDTREYLSDAKCITTLLSYLKTSDPTSILLTVSALSHLVWHDIPRQKVDAAQVSTSIIEIISEYSTNQPILDAILLSLCCLSFEEFHASTMLENGIFDALLQCYEENHSINRALMCILVRQLSRTKEFTAQESTVPKIIELVSRLSRSLRNEKDEDAALDCAEILCSMSYLDSLLPKMVVKEIVESLQVLLGYTSLETQWRCTACLCVLSSDSSCRQSMVELGCTRLLVEVAHSKSRYDTLHCCSVTLSNLSCDPANTNQMVQEQTVPALLHLAKIDNDVTRDACSLALANLSKESPTVNSGSVLALINLSMVGKEARSVSPSPPIVRPPPILNEHQKTRTAPPPYNYPLDDHGILFDSKYIAEIPDRQPPIPHLPAITVDTGNINPGEPSLTSSNLDIDEMPQDNQIQFPKVEPTDPTCHVDIADIEEELRDDSILQPEIEQPTTSKVELERVDESDADFGEWKTFCENTNTKVVPPLVTRKRSSKEKRTAPRLVKEPTTKILTSCASDSCLPTSSHIDTNEKHSMGKKRMTMKTLHVSPLKADTPLIKHPLEKPLDLKEQARKMGLWN